MYCRYFGVSPDEACTLLALTSEIDLHKTIRTYYSSIEHLFLDGFVEYVPGVDKSEGTQKLFRLTEKGQKALIQLSDCFPQTQQIQKVVKKTGQSKKSNFMSDDLKEFIQTYRELFPKGKVGNSTKSYRSTPKDISDRLEWFKKNYPEFWDFTLLLQATRDYQKYVKSQPMTFLSSAGYFIKKRREDQIDSSLLADWCQMIVDGNHNDEKRKRDIVQNFDNFDGVA